MYMYVYMIIVCEEWTQLQVIKRKNVNGSCIASRDTKGRGWSCVLKEISMSE